MSPVADRWKPGASAQSAGDRVRESGAEGGPNPLDPGDARCEAEDRPLLGPGAHPAARPQAAPALPAGLGQSDGTLRAVSIFMYLYILA